MLNILRCGVARMNPESVYGVRGGSTPEVEVDRARQAHYQRSFVTAPPIAGWYLISDVTALIRIRINMFNTIDIEISSLYTSFYVGIRTIVNLALFSPRSTPDLVLKQSRSPNLYGVLRPTEYRSI